MKKIIQLLTFKKIFFITLSLLVLILILLTLKAKDDQTEPSPKIEPPKIYTNTQAQVPIRLSINEQDFTLPKTLPVYTIENPEKSVEEYQTTANKFSFPNPPYKYVGSGQGKILIWSGEQGTLTIAPQIQKIEFKSAINIPSESFLITDKEIISAAKEFIISKKLLSEENLEFSQIKFISTAYDRFRSTNKNEANMANVIFHQTINGFKIVNSTPITGSISVHVNTGGNIQAVYIEQVEQLSKQENLSIKTFKELESSISTATLQSLDDGNIDVLFSPLSEIKLVDINKTTITYLKEFSQNQTLLQPIFVLEGVATLKDGKKVSALFYLPAISKQNLKQ